MRSASYSRLLGAVFLLVCSEAGHAAEPVPKLPGPFFQTQEERVQLDRARAGLPAVARAAPKRTAPPVINGFVKRSDGRATVWIDGVVAKTDNAAAVEQLEPMMVGGGSRLIKQTSKAVPLTSQGGEAKRDLPRKKSTKKRKSPVSRPTHSMRR